jgi:hypothetical protein
MKFNRSIIIFLSVLFLSSCRTSPANETNDEVIDLYKDTSIKFARRFLIDQGKDFKVIHILANRETSDTSATFILYDSVKPNLKYKHAHFIKKPCTRIVVLSSIYANMISEVGGLKNIVAIEIFFNEILVQKQIYFGLISTKNIL